MRGGFLIRAVALKNNAEFATSQILPMHETHILRDAGTPADRPALA
jgi:hypothetical protein